MHRSNSALHAAVGQYVVKRLGVINCFILKLLYAQRTNFTERCSGPETKKQLLTKKSKTGLKAQIFK